MDSEVKMMLNTILEEMGRVEERTNKRFDAVDKRLDRVQNELESMHHEINACKLEKDTISLLIKKTDQPEKELKNWKEKPHNKSVTYINISRNQSVKPVELSKALHFLYYHFYIRKEQPHETRPLTIWSSLLR